MFGILAKFFRFTGRENGNKFKLSIVIGLIEALASAMKIPAIMYILIGLMSGKPIGKYIGGSIAIMVIAIVVMSSVRDTLQCFRQKADIMRVLL